MKHKIVFISDTHGKHDNINIPACDFLCHCGDFTNLGKDGEIKNFCDWLSSLHHVRHKIVICGNHELGFNKYPDPKKKKLLKRSCIYLENSGIEIEGVKFWGTPNTLKFFNWEFMYDENTLKQIFDKIPEDINILLSHGPPFSILDLNMRGDRCGSVSLLNRMQQINYDIVAFGHIHPSYGIKYNYDDNQVYINASICNDVLMPINSPIEIELEDGQLIT